jgi:hypothetical protein
LFAPNKRRDIYNKHMDGPHRGSESAECGALCVRVFFFLDVRVEEKASIFLLIGAKRFLSVTRPGIFYFYFFFYLRIKERDTNLN